MIVDLVVKSSITDNMFIEDASYNKERHLFYTFRICDASISLMHDLLQNNPDLVINQIDHSYFSELTGNFVLLPEITKSSDALPDLLMSDAHHQNMTLYQQIYERLVDNGMSRDQAWSAVRYLLPLGHCAPFLVTGSLAAWIALVQLVHDTSSIEKRKFTYLTLYRLYQTIPDSIGYLWEMYRDTFLNDTFVTG